MSRCSLCPEKHKCIPASGPRDADYMLIGEAPGFDENRNNEVFTGKTGQELDNHFLPLGSLRRPDVYITNAVKCLPDRTKGKLSMQEEKDKLLAETCAAHFLIDEIVQVNPKIIIAMGAFACHVIDDTIDLVLHHGIPRQTKYGLVMPMYHPAGGLHEPKKMLHIRTDWIRLRRLIHGTLKIYQDEYPDTDYREVEDVDEIYSLDPTVNMGRDTEFTPMGDAHCMTYSTAPGTGRLIMADRKDLLEAFNEVMQEWCGLILFHNWLADKPKDEQMGIFNPTHLIRDTMTRISLLGNLPKALKVYSYRELGMKMTDFEDVVTPYSVPRILRYFMAINEVKWDRPPEQLKFDIKKDKWKLYKPQSMNTKLSRFFTELAKNPNKEVLGMWDNWEDQHEEIQAKCGYYTALDIRDLPMVELIDYACRDADATLRAWPILVQMVKSMPGKAQENWRL
jgi:DNA polymerase